MVFLKGLYQIFFERLLTVKVEILVFEETLIEIINILLKIQMLFSITQWLQRILKSTLKCSIIFSQGGKNGPL